MIIFKKKNPVVKNTGLFLGIYPFASSYVFQWIDEQNKKRKAHLIFIIQIKGDSYFCI